jgi:hypothetical protein
MRCYHKSNLCLDNKYQTRVERANAPALNTAVLITDVNSLQQMPLVVNEIQQFVANSFTVNAPGDK